MAGEQATTYGTGALYRGGRSGRGGKAPILGITKLKEAGITPTGSNDLDNAYLQAYDAAMRQINSTGSSGGAGGNPYAGLMNSLSGMHNQAAGQIGSATNDLITFLNQQKNPYANMQSQSVQATPQLQELLKSQGVNTSPLEQLAAVTQAQNTGQATAYNNLNATLSNMWNAGQQQQLQNAATDKASALQSLAGTTMGYGNNLLGKKAPNRQALIQLINALSGAK